MIDPSDGPPVVISPQIILFHEPIYSLDFHDEPEVAERHISVSDAKTLMSTPTEAIAALNAYSLQLSRLKIKNIQPYTPTESTVACSPYDFHITYPRDEALYVFFFANDQHLTPHHTVILARVMNRLQIPHPLPSTDGPNRSVHE